MVSMLAVAVCAVLAGACTFAAIADWARDLDRAGWARLGFTDRVPAATTVWRLLIRIDSKGAVGGVGRVATGPGRAGGGRGSAVAAGDRH